ncbi:MAG: hypothetical protein DRP50_08855 [Thermotoga sp.]|nr:MAG: hypothetical protein DRP50_08855 [Thermotoga sp.]
MMKKITILTVILVLVVSFAFAGTGKTVKEVMMENLPEIQKAIQTEHLAWKAGVSQGFLDEYGDVDFDTLIHDWTSYKQLPDSIKSKIRDYIIALSQKRPLKLTTTDDMIMSSFTLYKAMEDVDTSAASYTVLHTPVKDQGVHGTCWAFSTVGSLESALMVQKEESNPDLSEQFVAYHDIDWDLLYANGAIQDCAADVGGNYYFSTYNNIRYGVPPEVDFPYEAYTQTLSIKWNPANSTWKDDLIHSNRTALVIGALYSKDYLDYTYDEYIDSIKEMLQKYGALSVSFLVPNSFFSYTGGVYTPAPGFDEVIGYVGGHAVTLVGWSDVNNLVSSGVLSATETGVSTSTNSYTYYEPFTEATYTATLFWKVKNSWNTDWGENGYFWVPAITETQYDSSLVPDWQFEASWNWFTVPIFEPSTPDTSEADFNGDFDVDVDDFNALMSVVKYQDIVHLPTLTPPATTNIDAYDISLPEDGKVNGEDVARFMMLWMWNAASK